MEWTTVAAHRAGDDIIEAIARLLSDEWTRTIEARLTSIRKSSDALPACLAGLLDGRVVATARVSRIRTADGRDALLIESGMCKFACGKLSLTSACSCGGQGSARKGRWSPHYVCN